MGRDRKDDRREEGLERESVETRGERGLTDTWRQREMSLVSVEHVAVVRKSGHVALG